MIVEENQALCVRLGRSIFNQWQDLIFAGEAEYEVFPEQLRKALHLEMEKAHARLRYLDERLEELELRTPEDTAWHSASAELLEAHRASCLAAIVPQASFHRYAPSYAWDGYDRAKRRHRSLLDATTEERARLEARVASRLVDIDRGVEENLRKLAEVQARQERDRLDRRREEYDRFLRDQEEREERRQALIRSIREGKPDRDGGGDG